MRTRLLPIIALVIAALLAVACTQAPAAPAADGTAGETATQAPAAEAEGEEMAEEAPPAAEMTMVSGEINMARANWDTGWFQAEVFATLLAELGYEVELAGDLPAETFYPALANRDVDFWPNGWFPLHQDFLDRDIVAGKVEPVGFQVESGALQGFLVDMASAEEYGIVSLTDFEDPEIAAAFDTDGDGLADLTGCDAGWGCEGRINEILADLELEDSITHVQGTYSLLMADTIARYQRGEPILFYTWTPNWTVSELVIGEDVVWITVPGTEPSEGIAGCTEDPCAMGFVANDIRAVANIDFLAENPAAKVLLEEIEIPLNDIAAQNQLLVDGEDSQEDIARHAATWIEDNREAVDGWLEAARAAIQ